MRPVIYREGLGQPLALLLLAGSLVLLGEPASGKLEAAIGALSLLTLVVAVGLFALPRIVPWPLQVEQAVIAVPIFGLIVFAVPAFAVSLLNAPFLLSAPIMLIPIATLLLCPPTALLAEGEVDGFLRETRGYWPLALVAAAFSVFLVILAVYAPRLLDGWATTRVMRAYLDNSEFSYSGSFRHDDNSWPALLTYASYLLRVDALVLYRWILPPLVVLGSLLATWALALAVFERRGLALLTVVFYALILLTSIDIYGFQPGWWLLFSAAEDKTFAAFVLLPLGALFLLRGLAATEAPAWWRFLPFALLAVAIGTIHPYVAMMLTLVSAGLLLLRVATRVSSVRQVVPAAVALGLALLPGLLLYIDVSGRASELFTPEGEFFSGNRQMLETIELVNFLGNGWAVVHPRTIAHPLMLAGGALGLLSLLRLRNPGRQYILAALLVIVAVAFNPLALRVLGYAVSVPPSYRLIWLLPAALGLAGGVDFLLRALGVQRREAALGLVAPAIVAIFAYSMVGPWTSDVRESFEVDPPPGTFWDGPPETPELAALLRSLGEKGDVVLSPPEYNFVLPSYTSYPRVIHAGLGTVPPSAALEERAERYLDVTQFYGRPSPEEFERLRVKYSLDFLVLRQPGICQDEPIAILPTRAEPLVIYAVNDSGC